MTTLYRPCYLACRSLGAADQPGLCDYGSHLGVAIRTNRQRKAWDVEVQKSKNLAGANNGPSKYIKFIGPYEDH